MKYFCMLYYIRISLPICKDHDFPSIPPLSNGLWELLSSVSGVSVRLEHKKAGLVGGQPVYMSGMNRLGSGDKCEIVSISVILYGVSIVSKS